VNKQSWIAYQVMSSSSWFRRSAKISSPQQPISLRNTSQCLGHKLIVWNDVTNGENGHELQRVDERDLFGEAWTEFTALRTETDGGIRGNANERSGSINRGELLVQLRNYGY